MASSTTDRRLGLTGGRAIKEPCKAATTANITLSGEQTVDGVSCVTGDRVLVKSQTSSVDNGVYVCDTGTWTRDLDFDGPNDVTTGTIVMVLNGSANVNTYWRITTTDDPITFGTSAITFASALAGDSALVSFQQSGTGAVLRTSQDKQREARSLFDFIPTAYKTAIEDYTSTQDVDTYVQAAIDSGEDIDVGLGLYNISAPLTRSLGGKSFRLRGRGHVPTVVNKGTIFKLTVGSGASLLTYDGGASLGNCYIEGIKFYTTITTSQTFGLKLYRNFISNVINCGFEGFSYVSGTTVSAGIWVTGALTGQALITRILRCNLTSNADGIFYDKTNNNGLELIQCWIHNNSKSGLRGGDRSNTAFSARAWKVRGCIFESNTEEDIYLVGGAQDLEVSSYFEWTGTKTAITLASNAAHPQHTAVRIINNTFSGIPADGSGIISGAGIEGIEVSRNFAASTLYTSAKYFAHWTASNVTKYEVHAPDLVSGATAPITVRDNGTSYTDPVVRSPINRVVGGLRLGAQTVAWTAEATSWTPDLKFGGAKVGITYSVQQGKYVRNGDLVTVWLRIVLTSKGSSTGTAEIAGLPFAPSSGADSWGAGGVVGSYANMSGIAAGIFTATGSLGASSVYLTHGGAATASFLADTNFTDTSVVNAVYTYRVATS